MYAGRYIGTKSQMPGCSRNRIEQKQTTYLEAISLTTTIIFFNYLMIFCHNAIVLYPYYKNIQNMQVSTT